MNYVTQTLKNFDKFSIGFDEQYNQLVKLHTELSKFVPNYPPYNIYKVDENKYRIDLAVAGFSKNNIDITLDNDKLIIKGFHTDGSLESGDQPTYQGISNRAFTRMFALSDYVVVNNAELFNGMLRVFLERIIPEEKKPKKIEIQ